MDQLAYQNHNLICGMWTCWHWDGFHRNRAFATSNCRDFGPLNLLWRLHTRRLSGHLICASICAYNRAVPYIVVYLEVAQPTSFQPASSFGGSVEMTKTTTCEVSEKEVKAQEQNADRVLRYLLDSTTYEAMK